MWESLLYAQQMYNDALESVSIVVSHFDLILVFGVIWKF